MNNTALPVYRYLRGYSLDPGFSTRLDTAVINEVVYRVPFEPLQPGPVGEYVEVLDFDPASGCWYEPVDLSHEALATQQGLSPSEGNPQFHQQFVYAVAMKTIRHFEHALGRRILWSPRIVRSSKTRRGSDRGPRHSEYVPRLRIHPHALRQANAYYDADKRAVLFGYFTAANQYQGANLPGGTVFTCLSPDIVAHEMTHAILDSIHRRYMEDTNPDVGAFHEGFADIVALLQRFTFRELVEHQLFATTGRMDRYNVLGELATQFGEALQGNRGALRSMIGSWNDREEWVPLKPDPTDYATHPEAHDRGAVLVAAVFDAFQRIYNHRTRDLFRIASDGTGVLPEGSASRDLIHRLAGTASDIAAHLLHICIRALDYCPPHDVAFGDYLRALISADLDIAPEDECGFRLALIEAFRARGILPDRVSSLSIDSLRWTRPDFTPRQQAVLDWLAGQIKPDVRELVETGDREHLFKCSQAVQAKLHGLLTGKQARFRARDWEAFLDNLGLTSRPIGELFKARDLGNIRFTRGTRANDDHVPPIEVHTVRPAYRNGRESRQVEQVLITLTQKVTGEVLDQGQRYPFVFRGGCSLILTLGSLNTVEYVIQKNIRSLRRLRQQVRYQQGETETAAIVGSTYDGDRREPRINFNLLHRS